MRWWLFIDHIDAFGIPYPVIFINTKLLFPNFSDRNKSRLGELLISVGGDHSSHAGKVLDVVSRLETNHVRLAHTLASHIKSDRLPTQKHPHLWFAECRHATPSWILHS